MLKHFVITRLGLCVYSEPWLASIIDLFEAITLPSLVRQTSTGFIWLLVIDSDMPAKARHRIESLLQPYPHFHVVPIDVTQVSHVRQGCFDWVWDRCQDFILERGLLADPCDYITTCLIDADDAWHQDVISTVNHFMSSRLPQISVGEEKRGTWLRHSSGIAATFPRGYKWFIGAEALQAVQDPFMSMAVFVTARFSSGISACSSRHRAWPSYCDVLAFEISQLEQDWPMWIHVRHDRTTQPWDASAAVPMSRSTNEQLYQVFGIDRQKVEQWREIYDRRTATGALSTVHKGSDASAQYDRLFRIAALNRQIEALKRRRGMMYETAESTTVSLKDMIAGCELQRALLVETLRASGQNPDA